MKLNRVLVGLFAVTVGGVLLLGGCSKKVVSRISPDETVDLSGQWNDTDSRLVAEEMIADCLGQTWLSRFEQSGSEPPTVIVGSIRNKSLEHISVSTFLRDIERAMVNSGVVQVVAGYEERGELRAEREDQRINASLETLKEMGREVGADFMLIGEINQINDREGNEEVRYYQTDLTLVNVETNVKAWIGQKKIKKYVARKKYNP